MANSIGTYICAANETFDLIALKIYGHEDYAGKLIAANAKLCHKLVFDGGEALTLPEVQTDESGDLPPWKR